MGSRSSPHQNVNTLSGLVVPFLLLSPPSKLCGSPSKNTTKLDHPLSTENAFKYFMCRCVYSFTGLLCFGILPDLDVSDVMTWAGDYFFLIFACSIYCVERIEKFDYNTKINSN